MTTIYRQSVVFPPDRTSYVSVFEPPRQAGRRPFSDPRVDRASRGLSVFTDSSSLRVHARMNAHLGPLIVRYLLPDDLAFQLEHVAGKPDALTLFMEDLTVLADYLDRTWLVRLV